MCDDFVIKNQQQKYKKEGENQNCSCGLQLYVLCSMQFLDPNSSDLIDKMPGDLSALNANGDERALETYGMVAVELTSPTGQKLNIADEKK